MNEWMNEWKIHLQESENVFDSASELFKKIVAFLLEQSKNGIQQAWDIIKILVEWHNEWINTLIAWHNEWVKIVRDSVKVENTETLVLDEKAKKLAQELRLMVFNEDWRLEIPIEEKKEMFWDDFTSEVGDDWKKTSINVIPDYKILLKMTDERIEAIKPTKKIQIFSQVIASFPELYNSFLKTLDLSRKEYQSKIDYQKKIVKHPGHKKEDELRYSFLEKNKKRVEADLTPFYPDRIANMVGFEENIQLIINMIEVISDIEIQRFNKGHRYALKLISQVINGWECENYYPEEVELAKKVLEVSKFQKSEWNKLFEMEKDNSPEEKLEAEKEYENKLIEFIKSFREGKEGIQFEGQISALFSEKWVVDIFTKGFSTKLQKKKIMNKVLKKLDFSEDEVFALSKKNILNYFQKDLNHYKKWWDVQSTIDDIYRYYPLKIVKRYWLDADVLKLVEEYMAS
jgi:hypothetical protein